VSTPFLRMLPSDPEGPQDPKGRHPPWPATCQGRQDAERKERYFLKIPTKRDATGTPLCLTFSLIRGIVASGPAYILNLPFAL